jgi:SAM-dependent methyltransferase
MIRYTHTSRATTQAEVADRYRLYERSVQCPEAEVDFISHRFRLLAGRDARLLREDFCGTAAVSCEWVRRHPDHRALGVDLDPSVLAWALGHNLAALPAEVRARCRLIQGDVRRVRRGPMDVILAMNFSYWLLRERAALLRYFRRARRALVPDGVFFLDAFGGYDAFRVCTEERTLEDAEGAFTYLWEQAHYNPIDGRLVCHIHFAFPDGSRLERAFSYDWRLWTLPELRELLAEAGFSRVTCYWQGWNDRGEADGVFLPAEEAAADAAWICYLSAQL